MKFAEKATQIGEVNATKDERDVRVEVFWGGAGTGKTREVMLRDGGAFFVNAGDTFPFDGYGGEKTICLDDFYGGLPYHYLLRVLHGWQLRIPVKGSHRYARWTRVFITSNKPPEQWYQQGMTDALKRRIHSVRYFAPIVIRDWDTEDHEDDRNLPKIPCQNAIDIGLLCADNIAHDEDNILDTL
jgi:hypothetical protein